MSTIDTLALTVHELGSMLLAWVAGSPADESAVLLLIAHRSWLARDDFRVRLVDAIDEGWATDGRIMPMASIHWDRVADFLAAEEVYASGSERRILLLAASLAGHDHGTSLAELLSQLDATNSRYVLEAIAHRCGWHDRGIGARVTGQFGPVS